MAYPVFSVKGDIMGQGILDIPIPGKCRGDVVLVGLLTGVPTALVRGQLGDIVVKTAYGETYAADDSPGTVWAAIARMREIVSAGNNGNGNE